MTSEINKINELRFVTERLLIRDHREEDLQGLASLIMCEKEMFYIMDLFAPDTEAVKRNLDTAIEAIDLPFRDKYFFAILEKETGAYVGEVGFTVVEKSICSVGSETPQIVELGYFIKQEFWGKGYVTEAARAVVSYAFEILNIHKIITGCVKDNVGSEKVMLKLGFTKEGELKKHQLVSGNWKDRVVYGYLKEDYR